MKTKLITVLTAFGSILLADHSAMTHKWPTRETLKPGSGFPVSESFAVRAFEKYEQSALDGKLIDKQRELVKAGYIREKDPRVVLLKQSCDGARCFRTYMVVVGYSHPRLLHRGTRTIAAIVDVEAGAMKGMVKHVSVGPDHCQASSNSYSGVTVDPNPTGPFLPPKH